MAERESNKEEIAILKSGGEPVAVIDNIPEKVEQIKEMLKAIWPEEKITVKIVKQSVQ